MVTRRQRRRLVRESLRPAVQSAAGGLCVIIFSAVIHAAVKMPDWVRTVAWLCAGLALLAGLFLAIRALVLLAMDYSRGPVEMDEGRIHPSSEDGGRRLANDHETGSRSVTNRYFVLAGEKFPVNEKAHALMADAYAVGLPVGRIYYLPVTRRILSIDILEMSPTAMQLEKASRQRRQGAALRAGIGLG
jgi:hypothetical protein